MKFDWDIARDILLEVQSVSPSPDRSSGIIVESAMNDAHREALGLSPSGLSTEEIKSQNVRYRHAEILVNAGLAESGIFSNPPYALHIYDLTIEGHMLLESISDPGVWTRMRGVFNNYSPELAKALTQTAFQEVIKSVAQSIG